jgi:hypothetical protein
MDMTLGPINEQDNNQKEAATRLAGYRRLIPRLPITMRPSLNRQLDGWNTLFSFERTRFEKFMRSLGLFQPADLNALTARLRALETKMGVEHWNFSQSGDTMENASLLARSAYYAEWRREVEKIFEAVNAASRDKEAPSPKRTRLILLILPECLPVDPATAWKEWETGGHEFKIAGDARKLSDLLLHGQSASLGMEALLAPVSGTASSDLWLIEADSYPVGSLASTAPRNFCSLNYASLNPLRDRFLAEANTVPKNIAGSDQVLAALRRQDWDGLWPAEIASQPQLRNFLIELFLSGNGALIFANAFVEWAASEALRRARPRGMVVRFGMRNKPKPFTGLAIFENQRRISTLPDVNDPEGSAIDALILARYVWLAAARYPEYEQAYCLCVSEFRNSAYLICPKGGSPPWDLARPITPEEICSQLAQLLAMEWKQ